MDVPADDFILLSLVNMKLRDGCPSIEELCGQLGWEYAPINERLNAAGFIYDRENNRYV